jgi:hypothetical protein
VLDLTQFLVPLHLTAAAVGQMNHLLPQEHLEEMVQMVALVAVESLMRLLALRLEMEAQAIAQAHRHRKEIMAVILLPQRLTTAVVAAAVLMQQPEQVLMALALRVEMAAMVLHRQFQVVL